MVRVDTEYISVGGNRYPGAADWTRFGLAYGADNNVALWIPSVGENTKPFSYLLLQIADLFVFVVRSLCVARWPYRQG